MNLGELKTNVTTWLNTIAFDAAGAPLPVVFGLEPRKIYTKPLVAVYLGPIVSIGHDEPHWRFNDITQELEEVMIGVRRVTIRLQFISFNQDWGQDAAQYAENFRLLTQSSTSTDIIQGFVNVGLWGTGQLIRTDFEWSGKMVPRVELDVTLGVRAELQNTDYSGSFLQTVDLEGQSYVLDRWGKAIADAAGNPIVDQNIREFSVDRRIEP